MRASSAESLARRLGRIGAIGLAVAVLVAPAERAAADAAGTCAGDRTASTVNAWHSDAISTSSDVDWFRFGLSAARHVLVTLGGLGADLSLDLYDRSCHLLSSSHHGGNQYEEIYAGLASGTYFARVTGVSGATSAYDLRFRVLANGAVVLSSRVTVSNGFASVLGEELNNTPQGTFGVPVAVLFYDRAGRIVTTTEALMDTRHVAPWQRTPFSIGAPVPPTYDHYRLLPEVTDAGDVMGTSNLKIIDQAMQPSGTGRTYTGRLVNPNSFPVNSAVVAGLIRNAHGGVLYEALNYFDGTLLPYHSEPYRLTFDTIAGFNRMSIFVSASR